MESKQPDRLVKGPTGSLGQTWLSERNEILRLPCPWAPESKDLFRQIVHMGTAAAAAAAERV